MVANNHDASSKWMDILWVDHDRMPQSMPDPAFPNGMDIDLSKGASTTCAVLLPYPARRCGHYAVRCQRCKLSSAISTAGRADDPRSVIFACKNKKAEQPEHWTTELARRSGDD